MTNKERDTKRYIMEQVAKQDAEQEKVEQERRENNDRIRAALEAADKATPGPWVIYDLTGVATKSNIGIAECWVRKDWDTEANATLIAAAPDMASEIVKLRKWQSEALPYIEERYGIDLNQIESLEMEVPDWENSPGYRAVMKGCKERLPQHERLIAEAKGE